MKGPIIVKNKNDIEQIYNTLTSEAKRKINFKSKYQTKNSDTFKKIRNILSLKGGDKDKL